MGEFKYIIKEFLINNSVIIIDVDLFSTPIFSFKKKNGIRSRIFRQGTGLHYARRYENEILPEKYYDLR